MGCAAKRLALVGVGRVARDQHLPALTHEHAFDLVAAVNRDGPLAHIPTFHDMESMLASGIEVDAVSLCPPPACRYQLARMAIDAGLHVMLEKPPAANVADVHDLEARAHQRTRTLFTTWHAREASGVEPARAWLDERCIESVRVTWKEDIRTWHPDSQWILQPGGLGVFDPGSNALSILTRILPGELTVASATLHIPSNCHSPIAADVVLSHAGAARVDAAFDLVYTGMPCWDIEVRTDRETLLLADGGRELYLDGTPHIAGLDREYVRLYRRFSDLISTGACEVDTAPLQLVEAALLLGRRRQGAAFHFSSTPPT